MLIEVFGDQVEDDFTLQLPDGVKELKYQKDAVIQGFQMLMQHNGLFLSDVVGLGKTMIATMIAKRFIEANGKNTKILVVYPQLLKTTGRALSNCLASLAKLSLSQMAACQKYWKVVTNTMIRKSLT